MMVSAKRLALMLAALGLMAASGTQARAAFITYTETVTGSGSFGGNTFTNQLVTISVTADTSAITNPSTGMYFTASSLATITVANTGSGTLMVTAFDNQGASAFGIKVVGTSSTDILDVANSALSTYTLATPIGPISGTGMNNGNATFATSNGSFQLQTFSGSVSFVASVPEPSSIALCGIAGVVGLGFRRIRRRRAA